MHEYVLAVHTVRSGDLSLQRRIKGSMQELDGGAQLQELLGIFSIRERIKREVVDEVAPRIPAQETVPRLDIGHVQHLCIIVGIQGIAAGSQIGELIIKRAV